MNASYTIINSFNNTICIFIKYIRPSQSTAHEYQKIREIREVRWFLKWLIIETWVNYSIVTQKNISLSASQIVSKV